MLHIVKLLQRRFPGQAGRILPLAIIASVSAALAGLWLLTGTMR